jgi:arylsulfatase A-like enzyme
MLGDAFVSPPAAAVYVALVLFVWDLSGIAELSYFGHRSQEAWDFAFKNLAGKVVRDQIRILALHVAIALVGGLCAWSILVARAWVRHTESGRLGAQPARGWRLLRATAVVLALHFYFFLRGAVETPQIYADVLYMKGGWRRSLQVFLTDRVGLPLLDLAAVFLCLVFIFGPLLRREVRLRWKKRQRRWWHRSHQRRKQALLWALLPFAVFALVLISVSWALAPQSDSPRNEGPNILILAADGMRADRLSAQRRKLIPNLSRLAAQGVVFERAYSSLARTFPAWVNLLSGRYPHSHGVRHMFPTPTALRRIGPVLPAHLAQQGVRTAVVSDYAGEVFGRVDLGFERVSVPAFDFFQIVRQQSLRIHTHLLPYITGGFGRRLVPVMDGFPDNADPFLLARRVCAALRELRGQKQFMLTAFFSTTHFPYAAPYPYYKTATRRDYDGPFKYGKTRVLGEKGLQARDIRQVRGLYDGTVAATDAALGMILAELKRLGLARNTIVVFTSDHGENIYEADLGMGHGDHLRGEVAQRIPLLIRAPGVKSRRISAVVRDVDLAPTLAALAGHPLKPTDGKSLVPLLKGQKDDLGLSAFAETGLWFTQTGEGWSAEDRLYYPEVLGGLMDIDAKGGYTITVKKKYQDLVIAAKHRCIITDRWKLIYKPLRQGVQLELYDVRKDPLNQHNLASSHQKVVERLWPRLRDWMLKDKNAVLRGDYVLPRVERRPALVQKRSKTP